MSEHAVDATRTPVVPIDPAPPRRVPIVTWASAAWPHITAAVIATAVALWTYRPWSLGTALATPSGDALAFYAWVRNITESGWYEFSARLNAPFGQNDHSYAATDEFIFALAGKVLAPLTGGVGQAVIWLLILSFPAAAVLAVVLARSLRIGQLPATLVGIAFALLPDHFIRGTGHFSLAQSWMVPIGTLAATTVIFRPGGSARRRRVLEALVLLGCAAVSLSNAYFAVFAGVLVLGASLLAWRTSGWRPALPLLVARAVALALPLGVATFLDERYLPRPLGFSSMELTRSAADSTIYGGKILAMLLPPSEHRNAHMRALRALYDATFPNPAEGPSLGLVATVGFIGIVIWAVLVYARPQMALREPVLAALAGLMWVALFTYVVGGLGEAWALALHGGGLRVWSRMHVYIGMLALLAVGVAIDRIRWPHVRAGGVVVLLAVVLWDQTSPLYHPDAATAMAVQAETTDLTERIAETVPADAMVYQYPRTTFPLPLRDTAPASAYDGFLPYLYSDRLRWSFGGLQGDPRADWQDELALRDPGTQTVLLRAAGFSGVLVDTLALTSDPDGLGAIRAALGKPDVTSSSGRWEFYRFSPATGSCEAGQNDLADTALHVPLLYPGSGFEPVGNVLANTSPDAATLRVLTLREGGWPSVDLTMIVDAPSSGLAVTWPDGARQDVAPGTQQLSWHGSLTSTKTAISFERKAPTGERYLVHNFLATPRLDTAATACLASS
jgi:phosphoglycerol transferase